MRLLGCAASVFLSSWILCAAVCAQTAPTIVQLPMPLLPTVAGLTRSATVSEGQDATQADPAAAAVLREDGLDRFASATYNGVPVTGLQFNDVSGAVSAFSSYMKPGARVLKSHQPGAEEAAIVNGRTLLRAQTVILIASAPNQDALLSKLVPSLPRIGGARAQPPLLPSFVLTRGLVSGSVRYALGPQAYAAEGGVFPATQLGWEKSAEAVTAQYSDKRGQETLTLLLYPTPEIAAQHLRALQPTLQGSARIRREGELLVAAQGSFSADNATNLIENVHLHQEATFDKAMAPTFDSEVHKTYSLLTSILVFCGVGALASVLLGIFLGGGRAMVRKMRGKDAATDAEFLSLHLANQNAPPRFDPPSS